MHDCCSDAQGGMNAPQKLAVARAMASLQHGRPSTSASNSASKSANINSRRNKVEDTEEAFEPWEVAVFYHLAMGLAVGLTLTCPVLEVLDHTNRAEKSATITILAWGDSGPQWYSIVEVLLLLGCVSAAFFAVHGSDPGWLSSALLGEGNSSSNSNNNSPHCRNWCRVCRLAPPLRSHHCRICQRCVATFDHHCEFIATCIGERNRCRFLWFLVVQVVAVTRYFHIVWLFHQCHQQLQQQQHAVFIWSYHLGQQYKVALLLRWIAVRAYLCVVAMAAWFLFLVHALMALSNSTTFEWAKSRHLAYYHYGDIRPYDFPFSRGSVWKNLQLYGCGLGLGLELPEWLYCCLGDPRRTKNTQESWKPVAWTAPKPRRTNHTLGSLVSNHWGRQQKGKCSDEN